MPDGSTDISLDHFELFWALYPRPVGKGAARAKFLIATRERPASAIIVALREHIAAGTFDREAKYIPHPATWLHQERYDDPVVPRQRDTMRNGAMDYLSQRAAGLIPPEQDMIEGPAHG